MALTRFQGWAILFHLLPSSTVQSLVVVVGVHWALATLAVVLHVSIGPPVGMAVVDRLALEEDLDRTNAYLQANVPLLAPRAYRHLLDLLTGEASVHHDLALHRLRSHGSF